MKRMGTTLLAALLALALLAACASAEPQAPESEPEVESSSESEPEQSSQPEPESQSEAEADEIPASEPEMESEDESFTADAEPFEGTGEVLPSQEVEYREPERRDEDFIIFRIKDANGNPVPYVAGSLEWKSGQGEQAAEYYQGLGARNPKEPTGIDFMMEIPDENFYSDADGNLYLWVDPSTDPSDPYSYYMLGIVCELKLRAYYDHYLEQTINVNMPASTPATFDITWTQATPPSERPPQTTGVRFLIVDADGQPVPNMVLNGTDYPKEHVGPVPGIAGPFIRGDENGVIRWDKAKGYEAFEAGTYEIGFTKMDVEDSYMPYTLKHPGGSDLLEITVVYKY